MRPKIHRIVFLAAMAGLLLVLGMGFRWDMLSRIADLEALMVSHAEVVSDIIAEANLHGLQTYQQWEKEFAARLIDDARWISWMSETSGHDADQLSFLADRLGLNRITILDRDLAVLGAYPSEGDQRCLAELPDTFLRPLCEGAAGQAVLGFHRRDRVDCNCYVVGVSRSGGGAVVVDARADSLVSIRREIGPGHLLQSIGQGRYVNYVVIQDETGIQASSLPMITLPAPGDDPFLRPLAEGAAWVSREFDHETGRVFEVARVVALFGGDAVLRVGLDATPLVNMRRDIRNRTIMRTFVLGAGILLLGALLLAWQRQGVLDREVLRIGKELAARQEEARRLGQLAAMGSLASGVAHQIRNPLNSIHMIAQRLGRRRDLDEEIKRDAAHIRNESSRIEGIVQDFLEFARPRPPMLEPTDLAALVRDTVALQASAFAPRGAVITAYAPGLEAVVDRSFIQEILENLIRNAVEAGGVGTKVLVSLIKRSGWAEIVVEDDGPGVDTEARDRIFDLYYTTRPEGTGLGLSLAARMVADMGGRLELADGPGLEGKGARFVVRLPLRPDRVRGEGQEHGGEEHDDPGTTPDPGR